MIGMSYVPLKSTKKLSVTQEPKGKTENEEKSKQKQN